MEPYSRRSLAAITQAFSFSRCVFVRTRAMRHAIPKSDAATSDLRRMIPEWKRPKHHDRTRRTAARMSEAISGNDLAAHPLLPDFASLSGLQDKRKQNADRRCPPASPCGKRAPCRARSPVGVPRRLCPRDSRIPKCNPDQVSRSRRLSMAGVSRRRSPRFQRAPRMPVIMPADMMSEPPGSNGDEPFARGHRTRSRQPESPADVLARRARGGAFIPIVAIVNYCCIKSDYALILRPFLLRAFFPARRNGSETVRNQKSSGRQGVRRQTSMSHIQNFTMPLFLR